MLRLSLIGPGAIDFHYQKILGISKEKLERELDKIALAIKSAGLEISLLPDKGVSLEIAKRFKKLGGKVIGLVPQDDKEFGINHLKEYIEARVDNILVFDKLINTGSWYKHDLSLCLYGDVVLDLGLSPGTEGERAYGIYLYKLIAGFKQGVKADITKLYPQARAGKHIPYTIFVYSPFRTRELTKEEKFYAEKYSISLVSIKSPSDLEKKLKSLPV